MSRITPARSARNALAAAVLVVAAVATCGPAVAHGATASHAAPAAAARPIDKASLLHPKRKYYGVYSPGAPSTLTSIDTITSETGKQPDLDMYFQSWGAGSETGQPNFDASAATSACAAGMMPMLTWESWDTSDIGTNVHNGASSTGVLWAQPDFAPSKIIAGDFNAYIRATADLIGALPCPIAIRFDQEANGYWYPWGEDTAGMPGTPATQAADYIKMWRHVWRIFKNQGVTNVIWTWSPNYQSLAHKNLPDLSASYPGDKYVDWVGIDAYFLNKPSQTFHQLFGPTIQQMKTTAPDKPWLVAETGVGTYPDPTTKVAQITNLLHSVAKNKHFDGFVYFDDQAARSDWRFDPSANSPYLAAFKAGIASDLFATGKPGDFTR